MGLFGGGNKKTTTVNNLSDKRQQVSQNQNYAPAVVTSGNVNVSTLDAGAIHESLAASTAAVRNALDFGGNSLVYADRAGARAADLVQKIQSQATDSQRSSTAAVLESERNAIGAISKANTSEGAQTLDTLIRYGGVAIGLLALVWILKG